LQTYLPERYGAGSSLGGYALATYGAAKLLSQMGGGRLIDRFGGRKAVRFGLLLICLAQLSLLLAPAATAISYPAALVYGVGGAIIWPALYALTATTFAAEERGRLTSALTLTTGAAAATGIGLGLVLPASFSYYAALAIVIGALLVA